MTKHSHPRRTRTSPRPGTALLPLALAALLAACGGSERAGTDDHDHPRARAQGAQEAQAPRRRRRRLSRYRIDREIGRGGMAVVYAGWHEQLERPVALKVLAEHLADDDEFRTRFL